jgi:oligoribonuclease
MSISLVLGLDLETTGIDKKLDGVLEVGAKVVAPDFKIVDVFNQFVDPTHEQMNRMSPEVRGQHERSGLLDHVAARGVPIKDVDTALEAFILKFWKKGNVILMGTTIQFDRGFIEEQMPLTAKQLHYQMLDTRSLALAEEIFGSPHRSLADVDYSIEMVRNFVGRLK